MPKWDKLKRSPLDALMKLPRLSDEESFEIPIGARVFNFETQPNEDESFIYAIAPADGYFIINQFKHVPICRGERIVVAKSAEIYFDRAALV